MHQAGVRLQDLRQRDCAMRHGVRQRRPKQLPTALKDRQHVVICEDLVHAAGVRL